MNLRLIVIIFLIAIIIAIITSIVIEKRRKKISHWTFDRTLKRTGHPLIELYHNKIPYLFLIDTGSTHNLIDKNIINKLDKRFIRKDMQVVEGIGDINSNEKLEMYRIRFDDMFNSFTDDFVSYDMNNMFIDEEKHFNKPVIGILGVGFLSKYALTLDFKSNIVR